MIYRSYLADGRVVRWHPPDARRWAIDAELASQSVPPALARKTGIDEPALFWPRWTVFETVCKLLDESVLVRLRRMGFAGNEVPGIRTWTRHHDGIVVTIGVALSSAAQASQRR